MMQIILVIISGMYMADVLNDKGIAIEEDDFIVFSLLMLYLLMYKKTWVKDQFKNRSTGVFTKK